MPSWVRSLPNRRITVINAHGAYWHFRGLDRLCAEYGIDRRQAEFAITKPLWRAILTRDWPRAARELRNIAILARLCYTRDQVIVLGCAPFDHRLPFFHILARRHRFFHHTSWAEWTGRVPKRPKWPTLRARWMAWFRHRCQGVFAVSARAEETVRRFSRGRVPTAVVHHAVTDHFHARGRSDFDGERPLRLISVGRLVPSKGIDDLFYLADRLREGRFTLDIVGGGKLAAMVEQACQRRPHCTFRGRIADMGAMAACYREHDVLLLPAKRTRKWQELFGMVIIEAMACGVVPICTDHVGPCEILAGSSQPVHGPQSAGYLCAEADFIAAAEGWCRELAADPGMWQQRSRAAIAAASAYRDDAIAQRWEALFACQLGSSERL